jgi:hypothetical protein
MRQTILSVVLDVEPQSARRLSDLIEEFKKDQELPGAAESYSALKQGVPALHFMSMSVFESASYDPIFVIEANFDGPPGPFWAQMEAAFGVQLRPMLRCCKRPADGDGPTYDAVTKPFSRYPLAPYLEKRTLRPSVFHQGNRGLDRDRILAEGELFLATRAALAQPSPTEPNPYRGITAAEIHRKLRAELLGRLPWLAQPAPARVSRLERLVDWGQLVVFAFFALFCLSLPGMALAPMTPAGRYIAGLMIALVVLAILLARRRAVVPGGVVPARPRRLVLPNLSTTTIIAGLLIVVAYLIIASVIGIGVAVLMTGLDVDDSLHLSIKVVGLGFLSGVFFMAPVGSCCRCAGSNGAIPRRMRRRSTSACWARWRAARTGFRKTTWAAWCWSNPASCARRCFAPDTAAWACCCGFSRPTVTSAACARFTSPTGPS